MFGDSVIDQYNKMVEKNCKEVMKASKAKSNRDYLSVDKVFKKEIGGYVAPKLLNKDTFKKLIKNSYLYLGQSIPNEPVLEDLYVKAFSEFTFDEFTEFLDVVQSGGFNTIQEAYNSFKKDLDDRTATATANIISTPSIEITEDESVDVGDRFEQVYPPVGSEAEYGFAPRGRGEVEMSATMRQQQERLRVQREAKAGDRPVPQSNILTGARGRPHSIILEAGPKPPPLVRSLSPDFGGGA